MLVLSLDTPLPTYERWEEAPYDATALAIGEYSVALDGVQGTVVVLKPLRQSKAVSSPDLKPGGMCPLRQLRRQNGWRPDPRTSRRSEVPTKVVEYAIEQTRHRIAEAQEVSRQAREADWRAAFRPHAIILTERTVPQPIYVAAAIGVGRLLRIDFDLALSPLSYVKQALTGILGKLVEFRIQTSRTPEEIPAFGRPIGMIVNFTPDRAVRLN